MIGKQENSQEIYLRMYKELVLGTIKLINQERYKDAFGLYRDYGVSLFDKYCTA